MRLWHSFDEVDELLASFATALGGDRTGYRNHVYRVLNHHAALAGGSEPPPRRVLLAAVFHDLGIWTAGTFDYLQPSTALALQYLHAKRLKKDAPEVRLLIRHHHQLRRYQGPFADSVEKFRRADWVDVSAGVMRFGLPKAYLRDVGATFPDAGFHCRLCTLALRQFTRTPWRPLPMLRW